MKIVLYLSILYSLFNPMAAEEPVPYDLLNLDYLPGDTYTDDSIDGFSSNNLTGQSLIKIPVSSLSISNQNIPNPFIINTIFKFYEFSSSCLFTIVDRANTVTVGLCLASAGVGTIRVTLHLGTLPKMKASFTLNVDLNDKWTKLLIQVDEEKIRAFVNCTEYSGLDFDEDLTEGVIIDQNSEVKLGFNLADSQSIKGAVQELKIYTNGDNTFLKELCNNGSSIDSIIDDYDDELSATGFENEALNVESSTPVKGEKGDRGDPGPKGDMGPAGAEGEDGLAGAKGEKGQKGDTGQKGEPGESVIGPQGLKGPLGPQGPIGLAGPKGGNGTCSCSADLVSTLLLSMPKMRGPKGDQGPRGDDGSPGPRGLTGNIGLQGPRGPEGEKGERGERGDDGAPGQDGKLGPKGEPGKDGETGPPGPQGLIGPPGEPGRAYVEKSPVALIPGPQGEQGLPGLQGPAGHKGEKGEAGNAGKDGIKGERGETGHTGPEGPRGEKGERGEAGRDGIPGAPGNHGRPAEKAEKGDKGDKGERGLPAKLTSLLTDELDPKDNAAIVEKLKGPKGEPGASGIKGDLGGSGPIGPPGTSGQDGKDGTPGSKGEPGAKGDLGAPGVKGDKGNQGPPGPEGKVSRGASGYSGKKGPPGPRGYKGEPGKPGRAGEKGDKGPPGTMGDRGLPGINGTKGEKGDSGNTSVIDLSKLKGEKGATGDAGADGNPGVPGPPGPPGTCPDTCKPNVPEVKIESHTIPDENAVINDNEGVIMRTLVYTSIKALYERTLKVPVGTLAFVIKEEILLLRVESGWKDVMMSSLREHVPTFTTHTEQPATQRPSRTIQPVRPQTVSSPEQRPPEQRVSTSPPIRRPPLNWRPPAQYHRRSIRIAALNDPYDGAIGRVAAKECHKQAKQHVNNSGTFVPFLAKSIQDLRTLVKGVSRRLPVVNLKHERLFDSWESMFNGSGAPLGKFGNILSFAGRNVMIDNHWPHRIIWHGGETNGVRSSKEAYCNDWTENECCGYIGTGSRLPKLLSQETYTCDFKFIVLCVEQTVDSERHLHEGYRRRFYDNRIEGV